MLSTQHKSNVSLSQRQWQNPHSTTVHTLSGAALHCNIVLGKHETHDMGKSAMKLPTT